MTFPLWGLFVCWWVQRSTGQRIYRGKYESQIPITDEQMTDKFEVDRNCAQGQSLLQL
jgi:hypothetical protein